MTSLSTATRSALAFLALAALVSTALPADAAYSFGTFVDKNDFDFQPELTFRPNAGGATTKIQLPCFLDVDGNGMADAGESVYLAIMLGTPGLCGMVNGKYVRLTPVGGYAAGSEVKATDADYGKTLTQLGTVGVPAHALRVFKVDPDPTKVKKVDTVYLDLQNLAGLRVGIGDVRLAAYGSHKAGSVVQGGDADMNNPLVEMAGGATKSFYTASILYEYGKAQYLNVDQDAATKGVEEGDVRLTNTVPNLQGDIMAAIGNPGKVAESMSVTPAVARPGQTVDVEITVKNISTKVGSGLVETKVDDVLVDARGTPTLAVNEVAKVMFTMTAPMEPGRHKVQSGDVTFILDVQGEPEQAGPSQADFDALAAQVQALQDALARSQAAQVQAQVQPLTSEVETQDAPSGSPLVVFAGILLALAIVVRRRA